jgi:O-antigen ligase
MACVVLVVCVGSRNPFATFLNFGGVDSRAGWYRLAIWETAGPLVLANPVFGIGLFSDWDWQSSGVLVGGSVDALWLEAAMVTGIPGSLLIFLTMASPFWHGPVDVSDNLTEGERRLSVALGIVTFMSAFLAFVVHLWGADWILIAVFAGTRANLTESARMRSGVGHEDDG